MGKAKEIIVKVIPAKRANDFVKKNHYSGKVVPNSVLHFGVFYMGMLHGVMQYGPSINKKGTINLVKGTGWHEFIELNRMAFDDVLPRNSESRALRVSFLLIKKNAPHIKWIISFADATQCGHGTIYLASGFKLVGIAKNSSLRINPGTGQPVHIIQAHHLKLSAEFRKWKPIPGFQIKYVYFIDKSCEADLTVPVLPKEAIEQAGALMYKGKKHGADQTQERPVEGNPGNHN